MSVNKRFVILLEKLKLKHSSLAKQIGVTTPTIKQIIDGDNMPSAKVLIPLLEKFPTVNINWLLVGQGDMFLKESEKIIQGDGNKVEVGNNTVNSHNSNSNNINNIDNKIKTLEHEIDLLRKTIEDKDKIIGLLESQISQ